MEITDLDIILSLFGVLVGIYLGKRIKKNRRK